MKSCYFNFKDDVTLEDLADIFEVAWSGGIRSQAFDRLKEQTKRHFIIKERSCFCELCGKTLLVDDTCTNSKCENHKEYNGLPNKVKVEIKKVFNVYVSSLIEGLSKRFSISVEDIKREIFEVPQQSIIDKKEGKYRP